MGDLKLSGVETSYGPSQVLFGVDLEIKAGEVVTLMGRNGMGKTTTVRSIMGLTPAKRGEISFGGVAIQDFRSHNIAQLGIGYVPEGRQVFSNLTVLENLIATAANHAGVDDPWSVDMVMDLFPRLRERAKQYARTLSGGEQQRVALARAAVTKPKILLADEPTGNLDESTGQDIMAHLFGLQERHGATLVLVTHSRSLAERCDRVVRLRDGKLDVA